MSLSPQQDRVPVVHLGVDLGTALWLIRDSVSIGVLTVEGTLHEALVFPSGALLHQSLGQDLWLCTGEVTPLLTHSKELVCQMEPAADNPKRRAEARSIPKKRDIGHVCFENGNRNSQQPWAPKLGLGVVKAWKQKIPWGGNQQGDLKIHAMSFLCLGLVLDQGFLPVFPGATLGRISKQAPFPPGFFPLAFLLD